MYSNIILLLFVSLLFISTNGQCSPCTDCDADEDSCDADPSCHFIKNLVNFASDMCRAAGECASVCEECADSTTCSGEGPGCLWADTECLPRYCEVSCDQCANADFCVASSAYPYGCVSDTSSSTESCTAASAPITTTAALTTTEEPWFASTTYEDCPIICPTISLVSIGNITIEECPVESECDCDVGITSFTVTYLNDLSTAATITFYDDAALTTESCPAGTDVDNLEDVVCTIDTDVTDRFPITTYFVIEYTDSTIDDCVGSFDTSCTEDVLGDFGEDCTDLVIISYTDDEGDICYGNVSLEVPTTTAGSGSSSSSDSSVQRYWLFTDASESSSGSSRRRMITKDRRRLASSSSSSGSGSGSVTSTEWYSSKLCVPTCADWGSIRGIDCACYESCTADDLDTECYEGTTAGYCGTGVCCCGGECITSECDYGSSSGSSSSSISNNRRLLGSERCSASSDSGDAFYSYTEYFADNCGLTEVDTETYYSASTSTVRRRQLLGASFGSARRLQSSSSSGSSSGYTADQEIISSNEYINDFLIETCIVYEVSVDGDFPDCVLSLTIFLPLCENNFTDFNSSNLNTSDITDLITDGTFDDGSNVASAEGAIVDGKLGILVTLTDSDVFSFEICVGNVTVNGENLDTFNITTIDVSNGTAFLNTTDGMMECPIDGLPCFNFFFDAECPPVTTEVYRSCDCVDGMVEFELEYTGTEDVTLLVHRRVNQGGTLLLEVDLASGDTATVLSDPYAKFKWWTGITITDSSGEELCTGRVRRCVTWTVDEEVYGCEDYLVLTSWTAGDGALCDDAAITTSGSSSDSASGDNLMINSKELLDTPLKVFQELDPFVKFSMVGVLIAFFALSLIAGYICIVRKSEKVDNVDNVDNKNKMEASFSLKKAKRPRKDSGFSEYGVTETV